MNRPCSKSRSIIGLSLLLVSLLAAPGLVADVTLRSFNASYDLFKGGMRIGTTDLRLQRSGERWRWSSLTRARGIYAWFTDKQPYIETTFSQADSEIQLHEILVGDADKERNTESARFDWSGGTINVLRKGKQRQLQLGDGVYDFQSIHLLAAAMGQHQVTSTTVDFYNRGKLVKSRLVFSGEDRVSVDGRSLEARVYEQLIVQSNSKIKYYYDADNPLLPLRIEKLESGESPVILTLRGVEWDL
ncbi:MAG: DUF3108 domain-containing protein [Gammaproteobacteria bacterium]|nr:DUF3108 domain-containing protein [Gammaproteobacteria bacterium]MDH3534479.1 DUF3108 domain-containing protein [Gammaproteobacteria bacterium]